MVHAEDGSSRPLPTHPALQISSIWMFICTFIVSFHNKQVNSKETVVLSSVGHSRKSTESKEGVMETSDL